MAWLLTHVAPFFTAGVIGAVVLWLAQELVRARRDKNARERAARYLAMRLAVLFEGYALECANRIADNELFRTSGGHAGGCSFKLPNPVTLPDSTYWEYLRHDLAERALTFPNIAAHADGAIEFTSRVENDPESTAVAFDDQAGLTGMKAWALACDLRHEYEVVPFRKADIGWDFVNTLAKAQREADARRVANENVAAG